MSQKKNQSNNSSKAANVATQTPQTINATEPAVVAAQDSQTDNTPETSPAEFPHLDNFPTLAEGLKFEVNGYKVTITGKEYIKASDSVKYPYTAWTAQVTTPDGTEKTFTKVRNTAIMNFCHASTGITHNGGESRITKVLTDAEIVTETDRRANQIYGLLKRADELNEKFTGSKLFADVVDIFNATHRDAIFSQITEENNARREQADRAKAANAERTARKETRDLQAEISKLIAEGNFAKAAELMQQKASATKPTEATETTTDSDETAK